MIYRLDGLSVVDFVGKDADKVLHNLTTNHVRALEPGTGCETFVTDVRGKTLGHVLAFRNAFGYRLIGARGQSERIVAHMDRYTIREDIAPVILDEKWSGIVITAETWKQILAASPADSSLGTESLQREGDIYREHSIVVGGHSLLSYDVGWLGGQDRVVLVEGELVEAVVRELESSGIKILSEVAFHARRTVAGEPWFGIDLDESNLPQEADRDVKTICFTKGCYLGQETIARLDALGQVQKKLVRWKIDGSIPLAGTTLAVNDKAVARLTSVAVDDSGQCFAIAMTRRSHFERGSQASGVDIATQSALHGEVI